MSNARNLANLLGTDTKIKTADIADEVFNSNRNLIINGAMQVAQRSTSETGETGSDYHTMDRWKIDLSNLGTWSFSQSSTAPDGFANSYKLDCTTADASPAAGDYLILQQRIEGQNLQMLKKGTSAAESVTVSFYIRSSVTGTYTCELYDNDNGRYVGKTFTVDAADTWERKAITFPGDTTGTLDDDNALSLFCQIWFAAGSTFTGGTFNDGTWGAGGNNTRVSSSNVNLASSTSNEAYVTGWQMEVGDKATPFEHRSYGEELALCQRYFAYAQAGISGGAVSGTHLCLTYYPRVEFRALPTLSLTGNLKVDLPGVHNKTQSSTSVSHSFSDAAGGAINMYCGNFSGMTRSDFYVMRTNGDIHFDAEL